jgi:hypothetical protein
MTFGIVRIFDYCQQPAYRQVIALITVTISFMPKRLLLHIIRDYLFATP